MTKKRTQKQLPVNRHRQMAAESLKINTERRPLDMAALYISYVPKDHPDTVIFKKLSDFPQYLTDPEIRLLEPVASRHLVETDRTTYEGIIAFIVIRTTGQQAVLEQMTRRQDATMAHLERGLIRYAPSDRTILQMSAHRPPEPLVGQMLREMIAGVEEEVSREIREYQS